MRVNVQGLHLRWDASFVTSTNKESATIFGTDGQVTDWFCFFFQKLFS